MGLRFAAVLGVLSGVLGVATSGAVALARSDLILLGMSSTGMTVSVTTALYVYVKVGRVDRQEARVTAVEARAAEIQQKHST